MRRDREVAFWARVNKDGPIPERRPDLGPCWLWLGAKTGNGYGLFWDGIRLVAAHRWRYQQVHGPLDKSITLDHLCRARSCVNERHVEPVTNRVNVLRGVGVSAENARKTHCLRGHELTGENVYLRGNRRHCRQCRLERERNERRAKPGFKPHSSQRTHCPKGHRYEGDNLYVAPDGRRSCRACQRAKGARRYALKSKGLGLPATRTHCPQGHPYDAENTRIDEKGGRLCRTCRNEKLRAARSEGRYR